MKKLLSGGTLSVEDQGKIRIVVQADDEIKELNNKLLEASNVIRKLENEAHANAAGMICTSYYHCQLT